MKKALGLVVKSLTLARNLARQGFESDYSHHFSTSQKRTRGLLDHQENLTRVLEDRLGVGDAPRSQIRLASGGMKSCWGQDAKMSEF